MTPKWLDYAALKRCDVGVIKAEQWRGSSEFAGLQRSTFWIPGCAEDDGIQTKRRITLQKAHHAPQTAQTHNLEFTLT
ncbi:MAG: hypothetical protein ABL985_13740 [Casimicrobium sp.]